MKEEFKIGDEVEVVENYSNNPSKVGMKGIIKRIDQNPHTTIPYLLKGIDFAGNSWCCKVKLVNKTSAIMSQIW